MHLPPSPNPHKQDVCSLIHGRYQSVGVLAHSHTHTLHHHSLLLHPYVRLDAMYVVVLLLRESGSREGGQVGRREIHGPIHVSIHIPIALTLLRPLSPLTFYLCCRDATRCSGLETMERCTVVVIDWCIVSFLLTVTLS